MSTKKEKEGETEGTSNSNCDPTPRKCTRKKLEPFPNKIMVKSCKRQGIKDGKPHPCDPKAICDPYADSGGECPGPVLCLQKLRNPMKPEDTRCKSGEFVNVASCRAKVFEHPSDVEPTCIDGEPCPAIALCRERVKNPAPVVTRCPSPHDSYSKILCDNVGLWQDPPIFNPEDETNSKDQSPKNKKNEEE